MTPLRLLIPGRRFRNELIAVGASLLVMVVLPIMAVFGMTDVPALATDSSLTLYTGTDQNENLYDFGYCTWWASKRRAEVGYPIPQRWGDAHSWDLNALLAGYKVDNIPTEYAIMQTDAGALGHVAFVEEVYPDGRWQISEMNVKGWDILSERTFAAVQAQDYSFIH